MPEAVAPAAPAAPAAAPSGGSPSSPPSSGSAPAQGSSPSGTPAPRGAQGAPAQEQPRVVKWKDTIDGKEVELEASEEELRHSYRKQKTADQRFEAAAQMRKQAEQLRQQQQQFLEDVKKNPARMVQWLQEQGIDNALDVVANALQAKLAEEEQLQDPNVRARVEAEQKLAKLEQERMQQEQERQTQAFEARVEQETTQIVETFNKALELVDLPADDDTLAIMAALESENRRRGLKVTPERLAQEVQDRIVKRGTKSLLNALKSSRMTPQKLLAMDPELTKAFRLAIIEEHRAKKYGTQPTQNAAPPPPPAPKPERPLTEKEAWEKLEQEKGRRLLRTI